MSQKWSVALFKLTFFQGKNILFKAILPYKDVTYYLRYFDTCTKLIVNGDANLVAQFKLLFLLLTYCALLQIGFFLLPLGPLARTVLVDGVFILGIDRQFYPIFAGMTFYTIHLYWAVYFQSNCNLNLIAKAALIGDSGNNGHMPVSVRFVRFQSAAKQAKYHRLALVFTNAMQIFILWMDFCLLVFLVVFVLTLYSNFSLFGTNIVAFPFLFFVLLFHCMLFFLSWISFGHIFCFMSTYGFITLAYFISFFQQNYIYLKRALMLIVSKRFNFCNYYFLRSALRQNLNLFLAIFICDAFFGSLFTVYLICNLPLSAYFLIEIAFGKVAGLMRIIMICIVAEAFLGGLVLHLGVAIFSNIAHKGGKILLIFTAKNSVQYHKLPLKLKCHLYTHVQRLVVKKKFGAF